MPTPGSAAQAGADVAAQSGSGAAPHAQGGSGAQASNDVAAQSGRGAAPLAQGGSSAQASNGVAAQSPPHDGAAAQGGSGDSTSAGATTPAASSGHAGHAGTGGAMVGGNAGTGAAQPTAGSSGDADPASCMRETADAATPTIYVIGDSTASVYSADLYPRMGWAQPLQDYFAPACAKVADKALSGRSSKSFYDEGAWSPIAAQLARGDFVLIQFGHNDEKSEDRTRYTEPFGSYQMYLGKYIDDALAAGATPILLTSIERNNWKNGQLSATHGDYPEAVRQLATKRQLTLVDMTALTHAHFERLGEAATSKLFMNLAPGDSPNYPSGNSDNTHLQEAGARVVADIALADLARQRVPIASLLAAVPTP
jgi:lysophospholipase L1-like esterase